MAIDKMKNVAVVIAMIPFINALDEATTEGYTSETTEKFDNALEEFYSKLSDMGYQLTQVKRTE